jgi:hypothetical protein
MWKGSKILKYLLYIIWLRVLQNVRTYYIKYFLDKQIPNGAI